MTTSNLSAKAERYLFHLCLEIPNRRVGSEGNRAATDFFAQTIASFGFQIERPEFNCIDWAHEGANLSLKEYTFEVFPSPYSLGCQVKAPLVVVTTVEELEQAEVAGRILLMRGEIAKEQLMPKYFPFYNPDEHKHIISLLEEKVPQAIVAATSRNPELVGGIYPFPLFEDGDFDIPSVFMTAEEGVKLAQHAGEEVSLTSLAQRIPSKGCNVIARKGAVSDRRIVLCAHIDTKDGTPGALDNTTGLAVLLLLAELLENDGIDLGIEIVAMNGEDYYAASGEVLYLQNNQGKLNDILVNINLDGAGYRNGNTVFSFYGCPHEMVELIRDTFSSHDGITEGEPWYQSDHMIFFQNQVPAVAFTSDQMTELWTQIAHTTKDRPELVDYDKLVNIALALRDLILTLEAHETSGKSVR